MKTLPFSCLLVDDEVYVEAGQITFLPSVEGHPLTHPLLTHFTLAVPTYAALARLHGALVALKRQPQLTTWSVRLPPATVHRMRGILDSFALAHPQADCWTLTINTTPI